MADSTVTYYTQNDIDYLVVDKKPNTDAEKLFFNAVKTGNIDEIRSYLSIDEILINSRNEYSEFCLMDSSIEIKFKLIYLTFKFLVLKFT